ncbi:hypothetical protein ABZ234_03610 [Nocardiopsis sp. NPDC006198]|uniref:hypothetical protein n=1 Tax=Nocardiopsis sp. NPDC006198 TaxID=3154472 RepID=UPI0033AB69AD
MSTTPPDKRVQEAYDAIATIDAHADRMKEQVRIDFGNVVNEVTSNKEMQQEEVADQVGKTREWVRRLQVKARNAAKRGSS